MVRSEAFSVLVNSSITNEDLVMAKVDELVVRVAFTSEVSSSNIVDVV